MYRCKYLHHHYHTYVVFVSEYLNAIFLMVRIHFLYLWEILQKEKLVSQNNGSDTINAFDGYAFNYSLQI